MLKTWIDAVNAAIRELRELARAESFRSFTTTMPTG